ncbi:MAG: sigma-70 family RNA polymerase sigma factor [Candidatus Melainabacteria bacterium]|nr:sigma-70 family RNA polymerase sigma factor [Candidatus Melainabacteria bacterium]
MTDTKASATGPKTPRSKSLAPNPSLRARKNNLDQLTESELVLACQRRHSGAFEHLMARNQRIIIHILNQLAPDLSDKSDLYQEVSIRVWKSIVNLKNPAAFKRWLNQIVTNIFYDELRKRHQRYQSISLDQPLIDGDGQENGSRELRDNSPQPDEEALRKELTEVIGKALSTISERFRIAVILRDVEGVSYEEIAILTNSELGTVKSRIARARGKVKLLLKHYMRPVA